MPPWSNWTLRRRRLTLVAMCFGQGMILLDTTIVNVALPSIQAELGATPATLEWVINAYVLALAALILVGGTLGDRFGRKRIYLDRADDLHGRVSGLRTGHGRCRRWSRSGPCRARVPR